MLKPAADRSGINRDGAPRLTFHDLRHTYGSHLARAGLDPVRISRQMGHSRPSITLDIYAQEIASVNARDEVAARLEDAFGAVL